MPFIPRWGYLFSYLLSGYRYALSAALWRVQPFRTLRATLKTDRVHSGALARHSMAKKIFRRLKSHYTAPACGFWIIKFFQLINLMGWKCFYVTLWFRFYFCVLFNVSNFNFWFNNVRFFKYCLVFTNKVFFCDSHSNEKTSPLLSVIVT